MRLTRHECCQTDKHDDTPGDLNSKRETPLHLAVWRKGAGISYPIAHHGPQGDSTTGDTTNQAPETSAVRTTISQFSFLSRVLYLCWGADISDRYIGTVPTMPPTAVPAMARPARNIPRLTEAVWMVVPIVTRIHIICMKRILPSLSPTMVCNMAPTASPAI